MYDMVVIGNRQEKIHIVLGFSALLVEKTRMLQVFHCSRLEMHNDSMKHGVQLLSGLGYPGPLLNIKPLGYLYILSNHEKVHRVQRKTVSKVGTGK